MQRISLFLIAIMMMTTTSGQRLDQRSKGLAACACLMAQGDMERLEPAVRMALDNGVTINELKEALSQLYAYTHLTFHKDVQEDASNEWCEPVDDATYNALKQ